MRKKRFRAAATQTLARLGDIPYNIATSAALVEEAVRQGAELVVLPECMDTGYLFNSPEHCRRARRSGAGRAVRLGDGEACAQARHLYRLRHHRVGCRQAAHLQHRRHARPRRRGGGPLSQAVPRHPRPELVRLRRARLPGGRDRSRPHRPAHLLRWPHPGDRPLDRAAGRRDHRRHGELLRHGPGRHVGPGARL